MSAVETLREAFASRADPGPLRVLAASGQLGYGIPAAPFDAGLAREPHFVGADMGSIDIGPGYLGSGRLPTSPETTRGDLRRVLRGARAAGIPLLIGSAGGAGAGAHLDATLALVREIAAADGLHFRLASIRADVPAARVQSALRAGRLQPLGPIATPSEDTIAAAAGIVGQMGTEAFVRALGTGADVVVAGRACDTAIFASIPLALGFPIAPAMHMAKIIECASLCCTPGGRDALLGTLDRDGFELDSMNPARHATPMSVAAHSLYEQQDPNTVHEPEGTLHIDDARYTAVDEHRTRVSGSRWVPAARTTVKIEGATWLGERAMLVAGSSDPRFIDSAHAILAEVERTVRELVPPRPDAPYELFYRVYGLDGVVAWPGPARCPPREVCVLVECVAATRDEARSVVATTKQYLLHHGFPGRLSTGGNLAFPFTPPELDAGGAFRFSLYHVMETENLAELFPVDYEDI